ncbi:hypothetical protein HER46_003191 [Escherichia coli]|nr:hypothetical protein [Escherichia coli]EFP4646501.1 hypothetical protein [Escherichia coli]EFV3809518.1 hypothetical protein [Escherichia coli]
MAISIKGVNTGVIRKSNNFIALALKIKEPRNKECNQVNHLIPTRVLVKGGEITCKILK